MGDSSPTSHQTVFDLTADDVALLELVGGKGSDSTQRADLFWGDGLADPASGALGTCDVQLVACLPMPQTMFDKEPVAPAERPTGN